MNDKELKEIENLCNNATIGPWDESAHAKGCSRMIYSPGAGNGNGGLVTLISSGVSPEEDEANVKFITNARESIPKLIEEIRNSRRKSKI